MNTDKERLDLIEHYLQDDLSAAEEAEKKKLLENDVEFKAAYTEYQLLIEGIKFSSRNELLEQFKEIEKKNYASEADETPVRSLRKYYIGIAASIGLLLVSYLGVQEFYFKTPEKIAQSFFEPYPAVVGAVTRSVEDEKTVLENAMSLFDSGKYEDAISLFKMIDSPENEELINFYLANAYQAKGEFSLSIPIYEQIIAEKELFEEQAEWYLALAYLQTDQEGKAEELLVKIKNSENDYSEKAGKVLNSFQ